MALLVMGMVFFSPAALGATGVVSASADAPFLKDPFAEGYKITEEATAPDLKLESTRPQISPSFQLNDLIKKNRVSYFLMCHGGCDNLREALRHVGDWVHRYGQFGVKAYAFLSMPGGDWPDVENLRETFGEEVVFYTGQEIKNLPALMKLYQVDISPTLFVSTQKGFLMGRMTGYSPRDLTDWNDYFADMFRPLLREKIKKGGKDAPPPKAPENEEDEENPHGF